MQGTECPICNGPAQRLWAVERYWIRGCPACRHQFAEIAPSADHIPQVYGDSYFFGGGAGYPDYLREAQLLRQRGGRYARVLRRYVETGRLLDVGCAAGFLLQGLSDFGWKGVGVEPNVRMASYASGQLGLDVRVGSLETFQDDLRFDVVSMIQVLPHFVSPRTALMAAADVTKPGGCWLIETWDVDSWTRRLLGRRWHEYSPPSVLHWFSPLSLRRLTGSFGFQEVARGRMVKWINVEHALSLLSGKRALRALAWPAASALKLLPPQCSLPYPSEDLFWAIFRRS